MEGHGKVGGSKEAPQRHPGTKRGLCGCCCSGIPLPTPAPLRRKRSKKSRSWRRGAAGCFLLAPSWPLPSPPHLAGPGSTSELRSPQCHGQCMGGGGVRASPEAGQPRSHPAPPRRHPSLLAKVRVKHSHLPTPAPRRVASQTSPGYQDHDWKPYLTQWAKGPQEWMLMPLSQMRKPVLTDAPPGPRR